MADLTWLSQEAKNIHAIFDSLFYGFAVVLLLLGVVIDYFKILIAGDTWIPRLIGRTLIAAFLLHSFPEVTNALSDFTEALTQKISNYSEIHHVMERMGDKLHELSFSWTSVKEVIIWLFSFITYFLLYISVFITNAGVIYVWVLLYIFSPILIVLYILPVTSSATKILYRSLFEVCGWKITWAVLSALLWSSALSDMSKPETDINFLTVICYNLILAISLLLTPLVVNALISKGVGSATSSMLGTAAAAAVFSPGALATKATKKAVGTTGGGIAQGFSAAKKRLFDEPKPRAPRPPKWHKDIPAPTEPPGPIQAQLDREKLNRKKGK